MREGRKKGTEGDIGREKARGEKGKRGAKERKEKKEKGGYGRIEMQIEK